MARILGSIAKKVFEGHTGKSNIQSPSGVKINCIENFLQHFVISTIWLQNENWPSEVSRTTNYTEIVRQITLHFYHCM